MNVIPNAEGVKIYNVNIGKSIPNWISDKKKKSLRYDEEYRRRLELVQDLEFPTASQTVRFSNDGQFLFATGTYKPQLKVYELGQLSLKFERHMEYEAVQFLLLADDYSKFSILRADRTIEFHAQFGLYHKLRIPKFGRDMLYHPSTCDMYISADSNEVYRLNLEQGQFLNPLVTDLPAVNANDINPVHNLLTFGGENGVIECWDPRLRKRANEKDIKPFLNSFNIPTGSKIEVTSVKSDTDGLTLAVGTSTGHCMLFDLRQPTPYYTKDHQYGFPIKDIKYLNDKKIMTTDTKIMKIWEREGSMGKAFASIEPPADINDLTIYPNSGLVVMALEQSKLLSYFIPSLGNAPRWCSFLDNMTEELEESKQTSIYEDYKFVTREELESLGLSKLLGTEHLRAYMHGFFMDMKKYNEVRAIAQPFEYEEYKKAKIKEKLDKEAETRISAKKKAPKVNAKFAARLLSEPQKKTTASTLLEDPRFKEMFEKEDFAVDEMDDRFRALHPAGVKKISQNELEEHFDLVDGEDIEGVEKDDDDLEDDLDDEEEDDDDDEGDDDDDELSDGNARKKRKVEMYELKSGHNLNGKSSTGKEKFIPFHQRVKNLKVPDSRGTKIGGSMQMTFVPVETKSKKEESRKAKKKEEYMNRVQEKRGVQDLGLKKVKIKYFKKKK